MRITHLLAIGVVAIVAAACTGSGAGSASAGSAAAVVSAAPSEAPSVAPSATPDPCATANLALVTAGTLTIGTDNPAYPPYFLENKDGSKTKPWELGDPTNGTGFESAVGYAIAKQLGFTPDQVIWSFVPFLNSFAPGAKDFDFDLNQVTYKAERAQTADLSKGYYFGNQSLVVIKDSPIGKLAAAGTLTVSAMKPFVFGAQVGTTSFDAINALIVPTSATQVFDSNDLAIKALGDGSIDGVVVDLPTADFITNVQLENSLLAGQFDGGTPEYFSAVLGKDSGLTDCLDAAITALTDDGTMAQLASKWLPFQDSVPVFKP